MAPAKKGAKKNQEAQKSKERKRNLEEQETFNDDKVGVIAPKEKKQNFLNEYKEEFKPIVEDKFGVSFPDDFFWFHSFVKNQGDDFFEDLHLQLTGPYDMLNGNIKKDTDLSTTKLNLHGRFFVDTPEMTPVLCSTKEDDDLHIAYFRDSPSELPSLLVCCKNNKTGELNQYGDNIFAAVSLYIKEKLKSTKNTSVSKELKKHLEGVENQAKQYDLPLEANPPSLKKRSKLTVTKSFNKIGLVVPLDESGVGYRELHHSDRELKKVLTRIIDASKNDDEDTKNKYLDELQETITFIQFANDECDYGMGLEFGIDLFVFGDETFHGMIEHVLPLAYRLLKRNLYADILEAHLADRQRKGSISVL